MILATTQRTLRWLAGVLMMIWATVAGAAVEVYVVGVADGDTVTVLDRDRQQIRVRLDSIDSPEKSQEFGTVSRQHLARLVFNKWVWLEPHKTDRYGRTVGRLRLGDLDVNLEQVRAGMAWHYKAYANERPAREAQQYAAAEEEARRAGIGLWRGAHPTPPWEFRRASRR